MMQNLLSQPSYNFSEASANDIPSSSGVYVIQDQAKNQLIYVGRTKNLRRRLLGDHKRGNIEGSQFRKSLGNSLGAESENAISEYIKENCNFRFLLVPSFQETIRLEHFATAILAPMLNVQLKQQIKSQLISVDSFLGT